VPTVVFVGGILALLLISERYSIEKTIREKFCTGREKH
jgi:hypothetical protein